jgi:hypothetical protein
LNRRHKGGKIIILDISRVVTSWERRASSFPTGWSVVGSGAANEVLTRTLHLISIHATMIFFSESWYRVKMEIPEFAISEDLLDTNASK